MKKFATFMLFSWAVLQATAADLQWLTDLTKAQAKAQSENKTVLVYFTGSNWASNCMAFKREVLATPEFAQFAEANLVLVEVDFPRNSRLSETQKKANKELKERFNQKGFPTAILLTPKGEELGRQVGYTMGRDPGRILEKIKEWKTKKL